MAIPTFWLYRCGVGIFDSHFRRALFSETWLSTQPEVTTAATVTALTGAAVRLNSFWAGSFPRPTYTGRGFIERLWPNPRWSNLQIVGPGFLHSTLNINAPEAAFRLQRVGDSDAVGRLTLPILLDTWFTDLPHRRHVDMANFLPRVREVNSSWQNELNLFGRTYTNVIFHRRSWTWTPVESYRLLENPVRIWERWRTYTQPPHNSSTASFIPEEVP